MGIVGEVSRWIFFDEMSKIVFHILEKLKPVNPTLLLVFCYFGFLALVLIIIFLFLWFFCSKKKFMIKFEEWLCRKIETRNIKAKHSLIFEGTNEWKKTLSKEKEAVEVFVVSDNLYLDLVASDFNATVKEKWNVWSRNIINQKWLEELNKNKADSIKQRFMPFPYRYIVPNNKEVLDLIKDYVSNHLDFARGNEKLAGIITSMLFLKIDEGFFNVFGPHPEQTFYCFEDSSKNELLMFHKPLNGPLYFEKYMGTKHGKRIDYKLAFEHFWEENMKKTKS